MARKPLSHLDVTIIHGGDEKLRARAASVLMIHESIRDSFREIMNLEIDRAIIFSGAKTKGVDAPSEARKMYDIFCKRLRVLDAEKRIPGGASLPKDTDGLTHWKGMIGGRKISVYLEENSVDTEDNAEKSREIIQGLLSNGGYDSLVVTPVSSNYHMKRIEDTFSRYMPKGSKSPTPALGAEQILQHLSESTDRLKHYGELKEHSITTKRKIIEVTIRIVSKTEFGRKSIRFITKKRVKNQNP